MKSRNIFCLGALVDRETCGSDLQNQLGKCRNLVTTVGSVVHVFHTVPSYLGPFSELRRLQALELIQQ
eukprot:COSAG01_NODE_16532_length_1229_cov_1.078761_1_plen_67_part_10